MTVLAFTLLAWLGSVLAGFLGSLTGLGGGILIVPLLTLGFGIDIHFAIGASLVSIIGTSCGAAASFVKEGYTNIRLAMFLGIATTLGAIAGALLAIDTPTKWISIIFGSVLIITTLASLVKPPLEMYLPPNSLATRLRLNGPHYNVQGVPMGSFIMFIAGVLSGLLGIGSGVVKVLALDGAMKIPFKTATATSNLMIGVTAAASASLYFSKGYIQSAVAMPVMLGVLLGAFIGAKMIKKIQTKTLRRLFSIIVLAVAIQMIYHGLLS